MMLSLMKRQREFEHNSPPPSANVRYKGFEGAAACAVPAELVVN